MFSDESNLVSTASYGRLENLQIKIRRLSILRNGGRENWRPVELPRNEGGIHF